MAATPRENDSSHARAPSRHDARSLVGDRVRDAGGSTKAPTHASRGHYAWVIAAVGLLTVLACLGIGRFSLGMLLPSMASDLGMSYAQMGLIGTVNFIGYLLAVLACSSMVGRFGARAVIFAALLTVGATLIAVSRAQVFLVALVLYLLTGMGSGAANVTMMGLVSHWFTRRFRGRAGGIVVMGSGFAIMLSGVLVPAVNAHWGASGWRYGWLILGTLVLLIAAIAGSCLRNLPAEVGSTACGPADDAPDTVGNRAVEPAPSSHVLAHLGTIYFLFGLTYVIYATFIVTTLVNERGFGEQAAGQFWFWVGFLSLFSGPVFGFVSDALGRRVGLATAFGVHATAYLLAGLPLPDPFVYASVALFGVAAWSVPGIMAAAVGDYMGPEHAVAGFGRITFAFGMGQVIGPALAGFLAEASGSFRSSYLLAAATAIIGLLASLALKPAASARRS